MRPATTLGLYAGCLAAVLVAAMGVGRAVGPVVSDTASTASGHDDAMSDDASGDAMSNEGGHDESTHADVGPHGDGSALPGLAVSDAGYTLRLGAVTAPARASAPLSFVVERADGSPLTSYVETHTKELHLIVVRRDLTTFQHVHPSRSADGTWSVPVDLTSPGSYRVLADFRPRGLDRSLTLGADLTVDGDVVTAPLPGAEPTADAGDGYTVTLSGSPRAGQETELTMAVAYDGAPVTDLQPYLAAFGHLVALRTGDLAYLHVHPSGDHQVSDGSTGGPEISFLTTFPTAGTYRLFLDVKVGGTVRTAAFTVEVPR
jgi:hypothetical protein